MALLTKNVKSDRILISAVSGDIGGGVARIFSDEGIETFGCDSSPDPSSIKYLKSFFEAPLASKGSVYIDWIVDLCEREKISTFLPTNELEIAVVSPFIWKFEKQNIKVLINNPKIVATFSDKLTTTEFLRNELNIPAPKSVLLSEFTDQIPFPLIIKPRRGRGSKSVFQATSSLDINYIRQKFPDEEFVVQECVGSPDEEYTTAVFSDGHQTSTITFRRTLGFGGLSREVTYVRDSLMDVMGAKIASDLRLRGSINIQTRKVNGRHFVFEINPRISSTAIFRHFFGFKDVIWWFISAHGKEYTYVPKYRAGIGKRLLCEVYFHLE